MPLLIPHDSPPLTPISFLPLPSSIPRCLTLLSLYTLPLTALPLYLLPLPLSSLREDQDQSPQGGYAPSIRVRLLIAFVIFAINTHDVMNDTSYKIRLLLCSFAGYGFFHFLGCRRLIHNLLVCF